MLRLLNNAIILVMAAFSTASCVLWARSHRYAEGVEIVGPKGSCLATTHPGEAQICWPSPVYQCIPPVRLRISASSSPRSGEGSELVHEDACSGFAWGTATATTGSLIHYLQFPLWAASLACAAWPTSLLLAGTRRRWLRHSRGLCRACGYDLRATPQRCPECGTPSGPRRATRRVAIAWAVALCGLFLGLCFTARRDFRSASLPTSFSLLTGFNFDQEHGSLAEIPPRIRQLDGRRISIDGYMIPLDQAENMTSFALVSKLPTNFQVPLIQETIVARMVNGRYLNYCPDPIRISGTLHVRVDVDDGYLVDIYTITVDHVEPSPAKLPLGG